jgi:molybdopterin synthase catalytic subunit
MAAFIPNNHYLMIKNSFRPGPIDPSFIADSIAKHQQKTGIGAHSIFLGQVRADQVDGKQVAAIEYTANEALANTIFHEIREAAFSKYNLACAHIYHSIGSVETGKICLFVFTSSEHRASATAACSEIVERLKAEAPVWGKELFDDQTYRWKENRPL